MDRARVMGRVVLTHLQLVAQQGISQDVGTVCDVALDLARKLCYSVASVNNQVARVDHLDPLVLVIQVRWAVDGRGEASVQVGMSFLDESDFVTILVIYHLQEEEVVLHCQDHAVVRCPVQVVLKVPLFLKQSLVHLL